MQSTRLIGAMQLAAVQGELSSSGLQQSTKSGGAGEQKWRLVQTHRQELWLCRFEDLPNATPPRWVSTAIYVAAE